MFHSENTEQNFIYKFSSKTSWNESLGYRIHSYIQALWGDSLVFKNSSHVYLHRREHRNWHCSHFLLFWAFPGCWQLPSPFPKTNQQDLEEEEKNKQKKPTAFYILLLRQILFFQNFSSTARFCSLTCMLTAVNFEMLRDTFFSVGKVRIFVLTKFKIQSCILLLTTLTSYVVKVGISRKNGKRENAVE